MNEKLIYVISAYFKELTIFTHGILQPNLA